MPWPSISAIADALKGAAPTEEAPEAQAAATAAEAQPQPQPKPEAKQTAAAPTEGAPQESADAEKEKQPQPQPQPIPDFAAARAYVAALPEEVRRAIAAEIHPGMQRVVAKKDRELEALRAQLGEVDQRIEQRFDELLTFGMSEEDRKAYLENRERERAQARERLQLDSYRQLAQDVTRQRLEEAWTLVEGAGLPRDPNDARVRALDWAWDEPDYAEGKRRLQESIRRAASSPASATSGVQAKATQAAPSDEELQRRINEAAERLVTEKLKQLGVLSPDTGRSGSAGARTVTTMREAGDLARQILEQELGRSA